MKYTKSELQRIKKYCKRNYLNFPNVIGIGSGFKFINKNKQIYDKENTFVQFYVRKKTKSPSKKIPKFIYSRRTDGSIDYSKKIFTDVIHLDKLSFCCRSGSEVNSLGRKGVITLIFKNKIHGNSTYYAITCAHVAGGIRGDPSPPIESNCCKKDKIFAETIVKASPKKNILEYDIALAELRKPCTPQPELEINHSKIRLTGFFPSNKINTKLQPLKCVFPISNTTETKITGDETEMIIPYKRGSYLVKNVFVIRGRIKEGDSGGLLYIGTEAVGILIAKGADFGLFQPLGKAFKYLKSISNLSIKCFN